MVTMAIGEITQKSSETFATKQAPLGKQHQEE